MSVYTEKMVAELVAKGVWTYAETKAYAEDNGLKHRSVISKVKSLGLAYEPKPVRVTKNDEPVVLKSELVSFIEGALGVEAPSLAKATKADLQKLVEAVAVQFEVSETDIPVLA